MSWNAKIISVPGYSFISSESGLLFSRSSTQTRDPEVKIPILIYKKKEKEKEKRRHCIEAYCE